ncbi:MAG: hypothetical protein HRU33_00965 [Rhodobacteraceae bacterium]|nr:hypothetical protein [Paracoccaceae bacterium]
MIDDIGGSVAALRRTCGCSATGGSRSGGGGVSRFTQPQIAVYQFSIDFSKRD